MRHSGIIACAVVFLASAGLAQASCTQAEARAKVDTLNGLAERLQRDSPQYDQLLQGLVQIMREPQITESTCTRLDGLIAQARR